MKAKFWHVTDLIYKYFIFILAIVLIGCGQGMNRVGEDNHAKSLSSGDGGGLTPSDPQVDLEKIHTETQDAEDALAQAQDTLDNLIQNGQVNLPSSAGGASLSSSHLQAQSLTGIAEKLQVVLQQLIARIAAPVQKAKDMIHMARAQLVASMSLLDPHNPSHAATLARIQDMMKKLDELEARLGDVYNILRDKINFVVNKIDVLIARLSASGNPLTFILIYELQEVRRVLTTLTF